MEGRRKRSGRRAATGDRPARVEQEWVQKVAAASAAEAGVPVELLGEYLPLVADAAVSGRRARHDELAAIGVLGRRAAEQGLPAGRVARSYVLAAGRLWRQAPLVVRSADGEVVRAAADAVLRAVDSAVGELVDGYQAARRQMIRREESLRRELVDDLLRGDADVGGLAQRAEPFGVNLGRAHRVLLGAPATRLPDTGLAVAALERPVLDRFGDRDVLVATKDGLLVVLAPERPTGSGSRGGNLAEQVHAVLSGLPAGSPWRVAEGRSYPGAYGVARSYEEAREALALTARLRRTQRPVVHARDLLIYRVVGRDEIALVQLVESVLGPLAAARGGARPLLDTLEEYFAAGEVATVAAARLHLSVRAVTYRLARVRSLTGHDPGNPRHRYTLQTAVLGAELLGWPEQDLPASS